MTELEQAVEGFRRAEAALAEITADARALEQASAEAAEARSALLTAGQDLKVVAGALVGLASAHQELVSQLAAAASALRTEPRDERALEQVRELASPTGLTALDERLASLSEAAEELARRSTQVDPGTIVDRVDGATAGRLDDLERRLVVGQRRIYELVLAEGVVFIILAALVAFLVAR